MNEDGLLRRHPLPLVLPWSIELPPTIPVVIDLGAYIEPVTQP